MNRYCFIYLIAIIKQNFLLKILQNPGARNKLFHDERFYACILARLSQQPTIDKNKNFLLELFIKNVSSELKKALFNDPDFLNGLCRSPEFVPTLLAPLKAQSTSGININTLFNMVVDEDTNKYFAVLLEKPLFRDSLLGHDEFIDSLLTNIRDKTHVNNLTSILYSDLNV